MNLSQASSSTTEVFQRQTRTVLFILNTNKLITSMFVTAPWIHTGQFIEEFHDFNTLRVLIEDSFTALTDFFSDTDALCQTC